MAQKRVRLIQRRRVLGLSQEDLAERLEVDRTTIGRWESGDSAPQPWQRRRLAAGLDMSLEDLDLALEPGGDRVPGGSRRQRSGEIIDLDCSIDIDIGPDGWSTLCYRYELLNDGDQPFVRLVRDVWFEHSADRLVIEALDGADRNATIQRIHEAPNLAKFAVLMSPPLEPGQVATVGYTCRGGRFLDHLYWRHSIQHITHRLALDVRHRGAGRLVDYAAVEECADGSELFATESVEWRIEDRDVLVGVKRQMLRPGQSVTLRWAVQNPAERKA